MDLILINLKDSRQMIEIFIVIITTIISIMLSCFSLLIAYYGNLESDQEIGKLGSKIFIPTFAICMLSYFYILSSKPVYEIKEVSISQFNETIDYAFFGKTVINLTERFGMKIPAGTPIYSVKKYYDGNKIFFLYGCELKLDKDMVDLNIINPEKLIKGN